MCAHTHTDTHTHTHSHTHLHTHNLAAVEWMRPITKEYPETWDEPDASFESFVSETVRYRLGKVCVSVCTSTYTRVYGSCQRPCATV